MPKKRNTKNRPASGVQKEPVSPRKAPSADPNDTQWLQVLADVSPVALYRTDSRGACVWVNKKWREMTGYSFAAALGDGWRRAIHPEDRDRVVAAWAHHRKTGGTYASEHRYLRPDGAVRWALSCAAEQRDEGGKFIGHIGASVDVTEIRKASAKDRRGAAGTDDLTSRERQVAGLLADGKSNKQVAERLGISVRTAEAHRARIMRKLHLASLADLVRYALGRGLVGD